MNSRATSLLEVPWSRGSRSWVCGRLSGWDPRPSLTPTRAVLLLCALYIDIPAQIFHQNTEESITVKNQKHLNILVLGHSVQGNNSRLRQRRLAQGHRKLEIDCKSPAPWPRAVPPPSAGVTSVTLGKPERDGKQPFRM